MRPIIQVIVIAALVFGLSSCSNEEWSCQIRGETMYSMSSTGELGSADKGCSCSEIRAFELRIWGEVDEAALKNDFGC